MSRFDDCCESNPELDEELRIEGEVAMFSSRLGGEGTGTLLSAFSIEGPGGGATGPEGDFDDDETVDGHLAPGKPASTAAGTTSCSMGRASHRSQ